MPLGDASLYSTPGGGMLAAVGLNPLRSASAWAREHPGLIEYVSLTGAMRRDVPYDAAISSKVRSCGIV